MKKTAKITMLAMVLLIAGCSRKAEPAPTTENLAETTQEMTASSAETIQLGRRLEVPGFAIVVDDIELMEELSDGRFVVQRRKDEVFVVVQLAVENLENSLDVDNLEYQSFSLECGGHTVSVETTTMRDDFSSNARVPVGESREGFLAFRVLEEWVSPGQKVKLLLMLDKQTITWEGTLH